jgi:hypothetical protein
MHMQRQEEDILQGRGQSTASDKSSDDLFSLMTTRNTSSNLKKQGIDVNKVILERMAAGTYFAGVHT